MTWEMVGWVARAHSLCQHVNQPCWWYPMTTRPEFMGTQRSGRQVVLVTCYKQGGWVGEKIVGSATNKPHDDDKACWAEERGEGRKNRGLVRREEQHRRNFSSLISVQSSSSRHVELFHGERGRSPTVARMFSTRERNRFIPRNHCGRRGVEESCRTRYDGRTTRDNRSLLLLLLCGNQSRVIHQHTRNQIGGDCGLRRKLHRLLLLLLLLRRSCGDSSLLGDVEQVRVC